MGIAFLYLFYSPNQYILLMLLPGLFVPYLTFKSAFVAFLFLI